MGILAVLVVLLVLLLASAWSSAKSYFAKGRLSGMEEATLEIIRGVCSHYEQAGQATPDYVTKAVEAERRSRAGRPMKRASIDTRPGFGYSAMPSAPPAGAGDTTSARRR